MAWIPTVGDDEATGVLAEVYDRARGRFGFVPDAVRVLSLRPEVAQALDRVRGVLLGDASTLGARRADLIGTAVSGMNHCEYCGTAHSGLLVMRGDLGEDEAVAVYRNWRDVALPDSERAMLAFAEKLTFSPSSMTAQDVDELRSHGFTDIEILDVVLLAAYRNFVNRVHDGLGVTPERLVGRFGADHVRRIAST